MTQKRARQMAPGVTVEHRPIGRPLIVITADQLRQIERLAGYGLTEAGIADFLEMHPETFRTKKLQPIVFRALARGKAKAQGLVGEALYKRARTGDVAAIRWWEMTRAGRTEASRHEHTGRDGAPLPPPAITVTLVRPDAD